MREDGYYWVKVYKGSHWLFLNGIAIFKQFDHNCYDDLYEEKDVYKINETRILNPEDESL